MNAPWINANDDLWDQHDVDLPALTERRGRLGVHCSIIDDRDAIVGSTFTPAPPAQQYGFRLREWNRRQRVARMRQVTELLSGLFVAPEPF